ncbi:lisH domain-containing protein C1711.05-like isoform X1 [Colias croceus]|uniref:lisH domain-containing protein C1711.05-like isoform X1 n=1 Tax=Colias crocea TaxID=72248 RepID=UPI001E27A88E|nr:lisH domain-containing protein C1711.05-like isoform X1 [Colias croceus]
MSQKVTRKGPIAEDKEKRHADSPVKDMKKKMAANAEKEKQTTEKEKFAEKAAANDKQIEKASEKTDKTVKKDAAADKSDKKDKPAEKIAEKTPDKKADKAEKKEKSVEKVVEKKDKPTEKKEAVVAPTEKPNEESKENGKADTSDSRKKDTPAKAAKQNGARHNGDADGATVSSDDDDGLYPELAYEDSDMECFEPNTPDGPSRSYTRRSQVKASRTPETPRPASEKQADKDYVPDDSKESKLLKLKDDAPSDRKLRSSDSPKPQDKREKADGVKPREKETEDGNDTKAEEKLDVEVTIEVETEDAEARKPDTNYSKSRVKVSPYRRSRVHADNTQTSIVANYTGNNTTMEMDLTETSIVSEEPSSVESPYLSGLRSIRGRRSYKHLGEFSRRTPLDSSLRYNTSVNTSAMSANEQSSRPTGTVVGRKRKPEPEGPTSGPEDPTGPGARGDCTHMDAEGRSKRARLLDRLGGLARPFRFSAERVCVETTAEIVGINTDLPLTAPVATADPEAIKQVTTTPIHTRLTQQPRDKRCSIM